MLNKIFMAYRLALVFILLIIMLPFQARAHELPPTVVDVNIGHKKVDLSIPLSLEELIVEMRMQLEPDTDAMEMADEYDRLRALPADELIPEFEPYARSFIEDFVILAGDEAVTAKIIDVEPEEIGDISIPRETIIRARAKLPAGNSAVRIGWGEENGILIVKQVSGDGGYTEALAEGALSQAIPREGKVEENFITSFVNYIIIGFEHIIPKGLDHILFVLGLFFYAIAFRPMLWQVTTFTLAHSITLFMASLGWVNISASIVEPLIALSITAVAIENIMNRSDKVSLQRLTIIFAFGLLHGLGFASVLGDIGLDPFHLITSLIAFNIGVEFGQLAVIAIAFVTVVIISKLLGFSMKGDKFRNYISTPASLIIGSIGAWWFIERVYGLF